MIRTHSYSSPQFRKTSHGYALENWKSSGTRMAMDGPIVSKSCEGKNRKMIHGDRKT